MKHVPPDAVAYQRTPEFTEHSVPAGLLRNHNTKAGVWGRIVVSEGSLLYRIVGANTPGTAVEERVLHPGQDGVVEPGVLHEVALLGPVRFHVEFLRVPDGRANVAHASGCNP